MWSAWGRTIMGTSPIGYLAKSLCSAAVGVILLGQPAGAATEIGKTVVVMNTVTGKVKEIVRRLLINYGVSQNEIISTESDAASEIIFLDVTKIALLPRARVTLDRF